MLSCLVSRFEPHFAVQPALAPTTNRRDVHSLKVGGAERDRTDDLKLAKLALSQLSYSPNQTRYPPQRKGPRPEVNGGPGWS